MVTDRAMTFSGRIWFLDEIYGDKDPIDDRPMELVTNTFPQYLESTYAAFFKLWDFETIFTEYSDNKDDLYKYIWRVEKIFKSRLECYVIYRACL